MRNSDSGTNSFIERYLKANKIKKDRMNIVAYVDSSQSLVQFVKEGIGISIVSEMVSKEYVNRDGIHMYEIADFDHERNFYLVYNINRTLSVIAKKFIEEAAHLVEKTEGIKKEGSCPKKCLTLAHFIHLESYSKWILDLKWWCLTSFLLGQLLLGPSYLLISINKM